MKINEIILHKVQEQATAGATSAGNIATVTSPHIAIGKDRFSKAYSGSPGRSGTRAPRLPKIVQPKNCSSLVDRKIVRPKTFLVEKFVGRKCFRPKTFSVKNFAVRIAEGGSNGGVRRLPPPRSVRRYPPR